MSSILLVEDDNSLGYILKEYLQMHDFEVEWTKDGEEGLQAFQPGKFDICILDVMMPKMDGFALADKLKALDATIPLIFLTAKSMKIDKMKGFKAGADDYIVKPVDEEELIMRIQAVLRRSGKGSSGTTTDSYQIGSYTYHLKNRQLLRNGETIHLTKKEARVLQLLCESMGELVESDKILREVWGENTYFTRRSMDVYISKLRKYLSTDDTVKIQNMHGSGYILEEE
ncbi:MULTISPECIES: response regulator transcription factor [unclassified Imperialibacter]|uniref:response regulator transcription factor n=1 Tax=unclassified Imperialibacter TaxID=2629706 RepID=UPI001256A87A|nr:MULTISPECIES: response regulator transcription factor [unclassified Imperialibacter]CAD5251171.1 Transcriptional regulatory protein RprY [Imperialibacter sp. 89]CAD5284131.1 Transcriptional regulatory protein RprY [Imperialibacter sp. 75]VVT10935.1 Transcriptional regulatory protein RprY [Imperialibacter sp. EC-SDR9]